MVTYHNEEEWLLHAPQEQNSI